MTKKIICIRHGQATHNFDHKLRGEKAYLDPIHRDSVLLKQGELEAKNLNSDVLKMDFEIILVSPLTRTLQTCMLATKNVKKPRIALECVREFPCRVHTPNNRKNISILKEKFEQVDFSEIQDDEDPLWNDINKETKKELDMRIEEFKQWLRNRPEQTFILFSHASFINRFMGNTKYEHVKHCYPYIVEIN